MVSTYNWLLLDICLDNVHFPCDATISLYVNIYELLFTLKAAFSIQ